MGANEKSVVEYFSPGASGGGDGLEEVIWSVEVFILHGILIYFLSDESIRGHWSEKT